VFFHSHLPSGIRQATYSGRGRGPAKSRSRTCVLHGDWVRDRLPVRRPYPDRDADVLIVTEIAVCVLPPSDLAVFYFAQAVRLSPDRAKANVDEAFESEVETEETETVGAEER
jgi:hypothetical protein